MVDRTVRVRAPAPASGTRPRSPPARWLGPGCVLGKGAYLRPGACIGANVKIGNYACVFGTVEIEDGVLISPHVVLIENPTPGATRPNRMATGPPNRSPSAAARPSPPGITVGAYALVVLGTVVLHDVPARTLVGGNPAREAGWVCCCAASVEALAPARRPTAAAATF